MPLIITATDFSDIAKNAVYYACNLAESQEAELIIMHSYSIPLTFSDVPMPVSFINDTQHDAEAHMDQLVSDLSKAYTGVNIKGKVVFGDIIDAIDDYAADHEKPWMIVVGNSTTGDHGAWPDSTLIEAFRNMKYPVLAIPPGATFKPVKNICFAFDNKHRGNISAVLQLADITEKLNADLHVLNANTEVIEMDNSDIDPIVQKLLSPTNPRYKIVADQDIDNAIEKFVENNDVEILAMIPRRHSFFEGLFHKSHTKAVAHRSHIPMLALHDTHS